MKPEVDDTFIVVGDRILLQPKTTETKTKTGLFLPPGVQEQERIQSGYVVKAGPGYPIPVTTDYDEPWKKDNDAVRYIPLQAKVGDLAIYLQKEAHEIEYDGKKFVIIAQSGILLLIRDPELFS